MHGLYYLCGLVVAATLVMAAAPKLAHPASTARSFAALGVPAAPVAARVVPAAELAVAAMLASYPRLGAVAALVLLGGFTALLVRAVRAGIAAPCACFGSVSTRAVSSVDAVRNAGLVALAAAALAASEPVTPGPPALAVVGTAVSVGAYLLHRLRST